MVLPPSGKISAGAHVSKIMIFDVNTEYMFINVGFTGNVLLSKKTDFDVFVMTQFSLFRFGYDNDFCLNEHREQSGDRDRYMTSHDDETKIKRTITYKEIARLKI